MPPPHTEFYNVVYGDSEAESVLAELDWGLKPILEFKEDGDLYFRALSEVRPVLYLVKAEGHRSDNEVRLIEMREDFTGVKLFEGQKTPTAGARLYIIKERFFFSRPDPESEVILGPLSVSYQQQQGTEIFIKEVLYRLFSSRIEGIKVTQSKHNLRY